VLYHLGKGLGKISIEMNLCLSKEEDERKKICEQKKLVVGEKENFVLFP